MSKTLGLLLEPYGVDARNVLDFRSKATPDRIRYLDLLGDSKTRPAVDGVVEVNREPLAYVVDGTSRDTSSSQRDAYCIAAFRGDAPYLAVVEAGKLTLYGVTLNEGGRRRPLIPEVRVDSAEAWSTFRNLHLNPPTPSWKTRFIHDVIFETFHRAVDDIRESRASQADAISLAGRALFTRFLFDRKIVENDDLPGICRGVKSPLNLFDGPNRAAATCEWLDKTFNGDFLPLSFGKSRDKFRALRDGAFNALTNIMCRSPEGQLSLEWEGFNFAHIPIGILSQVYEQQAQSFDSEGRHRTSVYYTPRRIAEFMVGEVFAEFDNGRPNQSHKLRVLDPAVGGGVFLVTVFRELVSRWWQHLGHQPGTKDLRKILYNQIVGFDVHEPALQLTALSLYLAAIEFDPHPRPVERLRFKPLRGKTLHNVLDDREKESDYFSGSLGEGVGKIHRSSYDIVIGNPPWTKFAGDSGSEIHQKIVAALRPIARERLGNERSSTFAIPGNVPDLPFVWRAMEWARPSGRISFALHARLLFKVTSRGKQARDDIFDALTVTGVVNGADLRMTDVWPNVNAPFCILFAANRKSSANSSFLFVSPYVEDGLNRQGRIRIDSKDAHRVAVARLREEPDLLKVLFRGTPLDASVLRRLKAHSATTIAEYWKKRGLHCGQGYKNGSVRNQSAAFMQGMPDLRRGRESHLLINPEELPPFRDDHLHRTRTREIYRAPLVIVPKSLTPERGVRRALCSLDDVVFHEQFYGYSAHGHQNSETLARYLFLLFQSDFLYWASLVGSGQLGVERDALYKEDIDRFPFCPVEDLSSGQIREVMDLFNTITTASTPNWNEVDQWVAGLYGCSEQDIEVVRDTLEVRAPFQAAMKAAQRSPRAAEVRSFAERINKILVPLARSLDRPITVSIQQSTPCEPWSFIDVDFASKSPPSTPSRGDLLARVCRKADALAASQIIISDAGGSRVLVGILNEYRYWTQTRARLCAMEIADCHLPNHKDIVIP